MAMATGPCAPFDEKRRATRAENWDLSEDPEPRAAAASLLHAVALPRHRMHTAHR